MISEALRAKEAVLRAAVVHCEYADLPRQLTEMRRIAQQEIEADESSRREIAAFMVRLIEWAQLMITTQRQIWAEESSILPHLSQYLRDEPVLRAGAWQL